MRLAFFLPLVVVACDSSPISPSNDAGSGNDANNVVRDAAVDVAKVDASDAGDGGDAHDGDGGPIPDNTATCNPAKIWSAGTSLGLATGATFAAITGSATTIAWITTQDNVIHYADRDDTKSPWSQPQSIASGFKTGERVAVASNGLLLYAVGTDQKSIVAFTRSQSGDAFTLGTTTTLDNLNVELAALSGTTVSDLVLSPSSTTLVFRYVGSNAGLRATKRVTPTDTWPTTTTFAVQTETAVVSGKARRPTGISLDDRALFFWDEVTSSEKVGYFDYDATTMSQFVDLGARPNAQVDTDCTTLFYDDGAGTLDSSQ